MPRRSKRIKTATQSGGTFGNLPRSIVVHVLKFFDIHEVARLQRLVCREFKDAGQERIRERGGRKLFEEGIAYFHGHDHMPIDKARGRLLLDASIGAGCRLEVLGNKMEEDDLSDEEKQKILKDLKEIATTSPYHWVDYFIGEWYKKGWGGEENKKDAVVWWNKAIEQGNAHAMALLGDVYQFGDFGVQSFTKANKFYVLAANKGHSVARFYLGRNYRHGKGVEVDMTRCSELWNQSASQGDSDAQASLMDLYTEGSDDGNIPVNLELAFTWGVKAAGQGNVLSMFNVGNCYIHGNGIEPNDSSAFEWFMEAAEHGDSDAQYSIGRCYTTGTLGTTIDLVQAFFWYQKAAAQGDQDAMDAVDDLLSNNA